MRTSGKRGLGILVLLAFVGSGCKETLKITPSDGDFDVPVNAVIRIRYTADEYIRKEDVRPSNFQLSTCDETGGGVQDPAAPAPNAADTIGNHEAGIPVGVRLEYRRFEPDPAHTTEKDKNKKRSEILMIVFPDDSSDTPLKPEQCYQVTVADIHDEKKNLIYGATSQFTTEREPEFAFQDNQLPKAITPGGSSTIPPNGLVLLQFGAPMRPSVTEEVTTLCGITNSTVGPNTSDLCSHSGHTVQRNLYLVVSGKEEKSKVLETYRTYGLSSRNLEDSNRYMVSLDLDEDDPAPGGGAIAFSVASNAEGSDWEKFIKDTYKDKDPRNLYSLVPLREKRRRGER